MDVEQLVFELVDGFDVVHLLPYIVAGIEVQAEAGAGQTTEQLAEDIRRAHQVLAAGPLVGAEQHGAVLDGDLDAALLRQMDDGGPDLVKQLIVFLAGLVLVAADEGGDHAHAQLFAGANQRFQMVDGSGALLQIGVHGVGIEGQ